ncbi:MAG: HAMP domain-containing protein [Gammaproteobacteria bacterium]|nr:HAMP domain-containing protein [Gammaproteobacteria bacterium]
MRRRLAVVSAAVTAMVVLAFLIPLAGMVKTLARDRVLVAAERDAQTLSQALGVVITGGRPQEVVALVGSGELADGGLLSVVLPDETIVGEPFELGDGYRRAAAGEAFREPSEDGEIIWVPVLLEGEERAAVVRVFVASELLKRNVTAAWVVLGSLGVALVMLSALVADRLARSVVQPVRDLSVAAHRLGGGDLSVRVEPDGPVEIVEVGRAFNRLAGRVGELLEEERRAAADLSHRLRTPLTALRLEIEAVPDRSERLIGDLDELERTVDHLIRQARRPLREGMGASTDLGVVVKERASFWGALAQEQKRVWSADIDGGPHQVPLLEEDAVAVIDALVGNVLAHTAERTPFHIAVDRTEDGMVRLVVEDSGAGFPEGDPARRGESGSGSTGLGLDIVRRAAEATGGALHLRSGPDGGAGVEVLFGPSRDAPTA